MGKREKKVEEPPKICLLLVMGYGHICQDFEDILTLEEPSESGADVCCRKERCAFYLEKLPSKMEKCVFIRLAVSLGMIAERKPTSFLEQRLKKRLQDVKKQQSP